MTELGTVDWITERLTAHGGDMPVAALESALAEGLAPGDGTAEALALLRTRLTIAPGLVKVGRDRVALLRRFVQGAFFRYTPSTWELEKGVLRLDSTELALVCAQASPDSDQEVCWRDVSESAAHQVRLARNDGRWVLPGLEGWFDQTGFTFGDDLVVHVKEAATPLFVFDRVSRFDRDEGPIARRNACLTETAIAILAESEEGWMLVDRLLKLLLARFDFRAATPPDSFGQRLLDQDNRFTLAREGRSLRLSHFHHEDTARAYLATVNSSAAALAAFFEEYPPQNGDDRDKAIAYLEQLWRHTPRAELDGLTPAQWGEPNRKIVPFGQRGPTV